METVQSSSQNQWKSFSKIHKNGWKIHCHFRGNPGNIHGNFHSLGCVLSSVFLSAAFFFFVFFFVRALVSLTKALCSSSCFCASPLAEAKNEAISFCVSLAFFISARVLTSSATSSASTTGSSWACSSSSKHIVPKRLITIIIIIIIIVSSSSSSMVPWACCLNRQWSRFWNMGRSATQILCDFNFWLSQKFA